MAPLYTLPAGWTYSGGQFVRTETPWNVVPGQSGAIIDPAAYATAVTLTDSGDRITNRNALQTAVTAAMSRAGHTIIYLDGGEWSSSNGEVNVPAPSGANDGSFWCVIADKRLDPAKGVAFPRTTTQRVQSGDEAVMPSFSVLVDPSTGGLRPYSAFVLNTGARRFVTVGLHLRYDPSFNPGSQTSGVPGMNEGFFHYNGTYTQASDYPAYIGVDRCVVHGTHGVAMTRAFYNNGHYIWLTNSRVYDVGTSATDSQCLLAQTGAGPYLIQNNYLGCGWGENIMFGGGSCLFETEIPSDIAVVGNTLDQPYHTTDVIPYDHKNLFELKVGHRVLVTGNRLTNFIGTGDFGSQWYAVNIKAVSQDQGDKTGSTWWDLTHDVTIWGNEFVDCNAMIQLADASQGYGTPNFHAVEVAQNLFALTGATLPIGRPYPMLIGGYDYGIADWATNETARPRDIDVHHNTLLLPSGVTQMSHGADAINQGTMAPLTRYTVRDNVVVFASGTTGPYWGCENMSFNPSLNRQNYTDYVKDGTIWGPNAVIQSGITDSAKTAGDPGTYDLLYGTPTAAGVNTDGSLAGGSPLLTAAHDGGAMGADVPTVIATTALAVDGLGGTGGTPTQLLLSTQPAGALAGQPLPQQPVIAFADAGGSTVTSETSNVTASLVVTSGSVTPTGTLTKAAVSGLATFTDLGFTGTLGSVAHWRYTAGAFVVDGPSFTVLTSLAPAQL